MAHFLAKLLSKSTEIYPIFSRKHSAVHNISMRPLQICEFKNLLNHWPVKEGWNPGKYEYLPFYKADPNGHRGLFIDNKLIASLSTVRYSKQLAFLGLYIVDPEYREQGIGQTLVKPAIQEIINYPLIGINAVQNQVDNYQRKYGAQPFSTNSRYVGYLKPKVQVSEKNTNLKIVKKENININQLIDYDATIFSVPREAFLRPWIEMPASELLIAMEDQKICGYGLLSKCYQGVKIAPLFADRLDIAQGLYSSFFSIIKEPTTIQIDLPDNNPSAKIMLKRYGIFAEQFKTTRMYKGEKELIKELEDKHDKIYAHATLEIG